VNRYNGVNMRKSELNRLVDDLFHKHAKREPLWIVDFLLHCVIEGDLKRSVKKAMKYYLRIS